MEQEAAIKQTSWSCNHFIQNGDEEEIDCGGSFCTPCLTTSINDLDSKSEISVYPNPSNGVVNIKGLMEPAIVSVYNSVGKLVLEKSLSNQSENSFELESSPGLYVVELRNESFKKRFKLTLSD